MFFLAAIFLNIILCLANWKMPVKVVDQFIFLPIAVALAIGQIASIPISKFVYRIIYKD
jgi:hypothetical protein